MIDDNDEAKANDLVQYYYNNDLDCESISNLAYRNLAEVKWNNSIELFKKISNKVFEINVNRLKQKDKIKVAFLVPFASIWSCQSLYNRMLQDERYDIYILVAPFYNGTPITIDETYCNAVKYFKDNGYKTVEGFKRDEDRHYNWTEIGEPDIIVHLSPYYKAFKEAFMLYNIPLSVLNIYIPYAFMANNDFQAQFNLMSHLLFWKIFCETKVQRKLFELYSDIGDTNVITSGYVKMDNLIDGSKPKDIENLWKLPQNVEMNENIVKIIYAPHHSLYSGTFGYSTFDKNYMSIYEYAKKNSTTTSWIIKPHPLLKKQSMIAGLFKDEQEYDNYLNMWDKLPNAKMIGDVPYFDIFKTSDGMIFDSQSFRTEYLYVDKPSLYLKRIDQDYSMAFDELGMKILDVLYSTEGDNIDEIIQFVEKVLIEKKDYKKDARHAIYNEYLNYYVYNGNRLASDFILDYFKTQFE